MGPIGERQKMLMPAEARSDRKAAETRELQRDLLLAAVLTLPVFLLTVM